MILSVPTNILRNFKEFSAIDSDTWNQEIRISDILQQSVNINMINNIVSICNNTDSIINCVKSNIDIKYILNLIDSFKLLSKKKFSCVQII